MNLIKIFFILNICVKLQQSRYINEGARAITMCKGNRQKAGRILGWKIIFTWTVYLLCFYPVVSLESIITQKMLFISQSASLKAVL